MYSHLYSRFLKANLGTLHFTAHSHHFWPDVTREAMIEYWNDSAQYVDKKWNYIFSDKVPETQELIASQINLTQPENIVFAPNTHELLFRIFSCFSEESIRSNKPLKILSTDSEFYSFERQSLRLEEAQQIMVKRIPTQPFNHFRSRFLSELKNGDYDLVFISRVFFNSGVCAPLEDIMDLCISKDIHCVIDDYHGFMALPFDFSKYQDHCFYLAGSYKYAQGGEGCCFLQVPKTAQILRPIYTGWFADFADLENFSKNISYAPNGYRFAGATMDFSALYRLNAVLREFKKNHLNPTTIHEYVREQQRMFLNELDTIKNPLINMNTLLVHNLDSHGHFYSFELNDPERTAALNKALSDRGLKTDFRGSRLRFGFGLYHQGPFDLAVINEATANI